MRRKLQIRYLPAAENDLLSILAFIARDSPKRASRFVHSIEKRIGSLSLHPSLGRIPRHAHLRALGYRLLAVESYIVFHRVYRNRIEIHRIIHGSRDLDHLF